MTVLRLVTKLEGSSVDFKTDGDRNYPGIRSTVPYTSSAAVHPMSSFKVVLIPRSINGRVRPSVQKMGVLSTPTSIVGENVQQDHWQWDGMLLYEYDELL